MNRIFGTVYSTIGAAIALVIVTGAANAQASRTWVSGVGDDANPCSRTAPCKTFAGAISKTAVNGEINCLDPGGFGTVTITKSISIDCHEITGSILNAGTAGVNVAFDSFDPTDTRKTVNLRNLMIQGFDSGLFGIHLLGAGVGSVVNVEDVLITGEFGGSGGGIVDDRTRGALIVNNTTVRNVGGSGISVAGANGSHRVTISNSRVVNAASGVVAGANTIMSITNSVVANSTSTGMLVVATGQINADETTITNNVTGIQNNGTFNLSNSNVTLNSTAVSGSISSFTNNRFAGNDSIGGTINSIGSASSATGQR